MIRIVIGTEANQLVPQKVLAYSIRKSSRRPVEILPVYQVQARKGGTNFGFVRFTVPGLNGFRGKAIYLDADQLVFSDIGELYDLLDDSHAIALVNRPEGYFGGKPVGSHNQTSVMVLNCEKLKHWDTSKIFENIIPNDQPVAPGQIHYRDFMTLSWEDQGRIQALPPQWNHFNINRPDSKLTHFSFVRAQPWKSPRHALTPLWTKWLREALAENAVTKADVFKAILRRHMHPAFLRVLLPAPLARLGGDHVSAH